MNEIYRLSSYGIQNYRPYYAPANRERASTPEAAARLADRDARLADHVELSDRAVSFSREHALQQATARAERILRIRHQVESGTYETPERISATADRLVEVLDLH